MKIKRLANLKIINSTLCHYHNKSTRPLCSLFSYSFPITPLRISEENQEKNFIQHTAHYTTSTPPLHLPQVVRKLHKIGEKITLPNKLTSLFLTIPSELTSLYQSPTNPENMCHVPLLIFLQKRNLHHVLYQQEVTLARWVGKWLHNPTTQIQVLATQIWVPIASLLKRACDCSYMFL